MSTRKAIQYTLFLVLFLVSSVTAAAADKIWHVKAVHPDGQLINVKAIDKDVRAKVAEAAEFAQTDPEPDASELYTDILL